MLETALGLYLFHLCDYRLRTGSGSVASIAGEQRRLRDCALDYKKGFISTLKDKQSNAKSLGVGE